MEHDEATARAEVDAAEYAIAAYYLEWTAQHPPAWFWAAMARCFIRCLLTRPTVAEQDATLEAFIALLREDLAAQQPSAPGRAVH